jgi:hypothetical protein
MGNHQTRFGGVHFTLRARLISQAPGVYSHCSILSCRCEMHPERTAPLTHIRFRLQ